MADEALHYPPGAGPNSPAPEPQPEPTPQPAPEPAERPATGGVEELMAALEASLHQARERLPAEAEGPAKAPRRKRAGGAG